MVQPINISKTEVPIMKHYAKNYFSQHSNSLQANYLKFICFCQISKDHIWSLRWSMVGKKHPSNKNIYRLSL